VDRKTGFPVRRALARPAGVAVLGATCLLALLGPMGPADAAPQRPTVDAVAAHARVVGSEPANGALVARPPGSVALDLDAKPATLEGDPIAVWGPDGTRVDTGEPRVELDGRRLTVELRDGALPAGGYLVVYRVVSGDSHLITGRLAFRSEAPRPAERLEVPALAPAPAPSASTAAAAASASSAEPPSSPLGRAALDRGQRRILSVAGVVAAVAVLLPRRRRRRVRDA
jgi:methionine-rich copper-binding protein CopC